ncbi:hypothetical protein NP233_g3962 [Leucocoprinus birnbaumii]|uniref:Major facilitator superfamily (MFS) profile domain-containing protein n=1 Tax=Leucocoprinus birnbaumii TaxID=56174 RepID=A0AAD5VW29_9AGAR|nr:hypothetical protein NP233_g3962 [Leucocoprinus birnbaumii]
MKTPTSFTFDDPYPTNAQRLSKPPPSKRTSQSPSLLQPPQPITPTTPTTPTTIAIERSPLSINISRLSTFTHSSIASELDSPSVYSCDTRTFTRASRRQSIPLSPLSGRNAVPSGISITLGSYAQSPDNRTLASHVRDDSMAVSDPDFVQAIDDMSGRSFRLSLLRLKEGVQKAEMIDGHQRGHNANFSVTTDKKSLKTVQLPTIAVESPVEADFPKKTLVDASLSRPNMSQTAKWLITLSTCFFTFLSTFTESSYLLILSSISHSFSNSSIQTDLGSTTFAIGYGITPLFTVPLSDHLGYLPVYIGSGVGFSLMFIMIALAQNIQTILVGRFLQGIFASTGIVLVAGTIIDTWEPKERILPLVIFCLSILSGASLGPTISGPIIMNPHLSWRWVQWIQLIGTQFNVFSKSRRETTYLSVNTGDDTQFQTSMAGRKGVKSGSWLESYRRLFRAFVHPIVLSLSIWFGLTWSVASCIIQSIIPIFGTTRHFTGGENGLVFLSILYDLTAFPRATRLRSTPFGSIGSILGFTVPNPKVNLPSSRQNGPEACLYSACGAALLLPMAMFIYAWTAKTHDVNWIAPVIGITLSFVSISVTLIVTILYLAECFGTTTTSALSVVWLARNLSAMALPLFSDQMFKVLDFPWALTLFGGVAIALVPISLVSEVDQLFLNRVADASAII